MYDVRTLMKNMSDNRIKADNKSMNPDWAICFNFLGIPKSHVALMTATMMNGGQKCALFGRDYCCNHTFRESMELVEERLEASRNDYLRTYSISDDDRLKCYDYLECDGVPRSLFDPTFRWFKKNWYVQVEAHRCYFVPKNSIRIIYVHMDTNELLGGLFEKGIKEASFFIPKLSDGSVSVAMGMGGEFSLNTYKYNPDNKKVRKKKTKNQSLEE